MLYLGQHMYYKILRALKLNNLSSLPQEQLLANLRVALAHHSNALEGLRLSLEQTTCEAWGRILFLASVPRVRLSLRCSTQLYHNIKKI